MSLYLCHESALRYWLTKRGDECIPDCADVKTLAFASSNMGEIREAYLPFDYSKKRPLHVMVADRASQRKSNNVVSHVWGGPVQKGSFYELSGLNYVSSPEFTFVQMAANRSTAELVEIGCYLCGGFSISDKGRGYVGERLPLTTPEYLASYLDSQKGAYGTARARAALAYVIPNTASPMEVLLVMAFVLPPALGGLEMPEVVANQRIAVDESLQPIAEATYFKGDIYLPSVRGNVEYDSYEFHTGRYRLDHTQARRNVLETMDVKTISATHGQIDTFEKFEAFIWMVKERFGIEQRAFSKTERAAQMKLYDHLTSPNTKLF